MRWNELAESRPFVNHTPNHDCPGCKGARAARQKNGINPKSNRWYSKYSGK